MEGGDGMNQRFRDYLLSKQTFLKLTIGFILLSVFIIAAISALFRQMYTSALYDEIAALELSGLERTATEIERLIDEMDSVYVSVVSNTTVANFMRQNAWNPLDEYNVKKEFRRFKSIHSRVHSIYLYNARIPYFISTESVGRPYAEFADRAVIELAKGRKTFAVRDIITESGAPLRVLSILYARFNPDTRAIESCIVINVPDFAELGLMGSDTGTQTILIDGQGAVLSAGAGAADAVLPVASGLIDEIMASPDANGSLPRQQDGHILSYRKLDHEAWILINLQAHGLITAQVEAKANRIFLIGLVILMASSICVFALSKAFYTPIEAMVRKLHKSGYPTNRKTRKSELDTLMDGFTQAMNEMRMVKEDSEKSETERKEGFLRQILHEAISESELQNRLDAYHFSVEPSDLRAVVVRIDNLDSIKPEHRHLYGMTIRQIIRDGCANRLRAETIMLTGTEIAWIFNLPAGENPLESARETLFSIKGSVYQTLGASITLGIGCPAETFRDLKRSFDVACEMADNRFVLGRGQIIDEAVVNANLQVASQVPPALEENLLGAIRANNRVQFSQAVGDFVEMLSGCEYNSATMLLMQMMLISVHTMDDIVQGAIDRRHIQGYGRVIERMEVIPQSKDWFMGIYAQYQLAIEELNLQKNSTKLSRIIGEAEKYIGENLADVNLTIDTLASLFGYSANYFARMFKDAMGISINDYIRRARIDKAKLLLIETTLSANEVADLVGYMNKNYFFSSFKKETGLTPLAYRNAHNAAKE